MRFGATVLLSCILSAGLANAQEPDPRMGNLSLPYKSATYGLHIELPAGVPLCGMVSSYSSMEWFYIPVDPVKGCEQFTLPMDWEQWPDFVVIGPYLDTPMKLDRLDDYVRQETFFCAGKSVGIGGGLPRPSDAATSVEPAGTALLGLRTVTCTRNDPKTERYSKAFLSYKLMLGDSGRGYMVAVYARLKNKRAAERVLNEIVAQLKLLN